MQRYIIFLSLIFSLFFLGSCASSETKEGTEGTTETEKSVEEKQPTSEEIKSPSSKTASREGVPSAEGSESKPSTSKQGKESTVVEIPPFGVPGQCFRKVTYPTTYKEVEEKIMVKPEEVKIEIIPAKYQEVPEQVLVRPATSVLETVPPVFEIVEEKVITRPAYIRKEEIPPTYETVTEKVIDREGYTEWTKDPDTGLTCLVEVPPTLKEIQRQIMRTPALIREVEVPAEYTIVRKQVEKAPATTRKVDLPPVYKTVYVKKEIEPEKQVKTVIPPEYKVITKTVVDREAYTEWEEVLCDTNFTPSKVREIEEALKKNNYDPGAIDGKPDQAFYDALRKYQKDKGLRQSEDRYINMETLKSLGVSPR